MYIFGGMEKTKEKNQYYNDVVYWAFDTKEFQKTVVLQGEQLVARANHSCAWDENSSSFVIIGGKNSDFILADVWNISRVVCFVDIFPYDIIAHILSFVQLDDLVTLYMTSRKLHQECSNERLWERICHNLMPHLIQEVKGNSMVSYRQLVIDNILNNDMVVYVPPIYATVGK